MKKLMTTKQAAEFSGMSEAWFERMRWLGNGHGPAYIKLGRAVRYEEADLEAYFRCRKVG